MSNDFNPTVLYVCAGLFGLFFYCVTIVCCFRILWCIGRKNHDDKPPVYDEEQPPPYEGYANQRLPTYYELYELGRPWLALPSYEEAVLTSPATTNNIINNNNFIEKLIDEILIVVITKQQ